MKPNVEWYAERQSRAKIPSGLTTTGE
ncbi:uncharacterized protein METZ01_LOCUS173067 [marine metagenome]|uniref:Uncharacterized protein n=1 Tax=marine metagenome TaxID=408172 RepID=A0A382C4J5_9ZZZZ